MRLRYSLTVRPFQSGVRPRAMMMRSCLMLLMVSAVGLWGCAGQRAVLGPTTTRQGASGTPPTVVTPGPAVPTTSTPVVTLKVALLPLDPGAKGLITLLTTLQDTFDGALAIQLMYGVRQNPASRRLESPYGAADVEEAARRRLLAERAPEALWRYLTAFDNTPGSASWQAALATAGLPAKRIQEFAPPVVSADGESLLRQDLAWLRAHSTAEEVPALFVHDHLYEGPPWMNSLKAVINQRIRDADARLARADIPACYTDYDFTRKDYQGHCQNPGTLQAQIVWQPAPTVRLTVITDKTAPLLNARTTLAQIKRQLPGLRETTLDFRDRAAQPWRPLLQQALPLPLYLFDQSVEAAASFAEMKQRKWLMPVGSSSTEGQRRPRWYLMHPELIGDAMAFTQRPRQIKTLDIFIMSQCPFGTQATVTLLEAKRRQRIPQDLTLRWHYIADRSTTTPSGFVSLHGPDEVAEDVRQLVIQANFQAQFPVYLEKRFGDFAQKSWQEAAQASGLDPGRLEELVRLEGAQRLGEEVRITNTLAVRSSPSFLWENQLLIRDLRQLTKLPTFQRLELNPVAGSCRK